MHCSVLLVTSLLFVEAGPTKLIDNLITERWKQEGVQPATGPTTKQSNHGINSVQTF